MRDKEIVYHMDKQKKGVKIELSIVHCPEHEFFAVILDDDRLVGFPKCCGKWITLKIIDADVDDIQRIIDRRRRYVAQDKRNA